MLVDWARAERNIDRMQAAANAGGKRLRPHAKTHKSPEVAQLQIARGAAGICCAKLGEAEVFADAGISDIRLPYPLHPSNADRVLALLDRARISFIVDHETVARGWSAAMQAAGREVEVLVKVDVGTHRCGIDPDAPGAAALVARIAALPGLRFRGLLSHAGHSYGASSDADIATIAAAEAGTLTALAGRVAELGVTLRGDQRRRNADGAPQRAARRPDRAAAGQLRLLRPHAGGARLRKLAGLRLDGAGDASSASRRAIGSSSIAAARPSPTMWCAGQGTPPATGSCWQRSTATVRMAALLIERLSEEHATVTVRGTTALTPGDLVRVVPNHSCVVSNMVDEAWRLDGAEVLGPLAIAARGRIT